MTLGMLKIVFIDRNIRHPEFVNYSNQQFLLDIVCNGLFYPAFI